MSVIKNRRCLWAIVLIAIALRIVAAWTWRDRLLEDVDGYHGIARMLADGRGYSDAVSGRPTAFRPPLFPLMLACILKLRGGTAAIAAMQVVLGAVTVLLTGLTASRLNLRAAWFPPLLVAVDPLLLAYTPRVMTEVASALTIAVLLWLVSTQRGSSIQRAAVVGLAFGMAALCRPTVWAILPFVALFATVAVLRGRRLAGAWLKSALAFSGCAAILVLPWLLRNTKAIDAAVFTTTHGGYTLLLGNNPDFYAKVASGEWGTVWDSIPWQHQLREELKRDGVDPHDERAKDRWMYARAFGNMRADLGGCAASCWLRVRRLWALAPLVETQSTVVTGSVRAFYVLVFAGVVVSIFRGNQEAHQHVFMLAWCMLLAFTAVHLFYWANARMRAPIVVAIALLSARGWAGFRPTAEHTN